jgi:hypothetical protein
MVYNVAEVDTRLWICSSSPGKSIRPDDLGCKLDYDYPAESIRTAKQTAAKILDCNIKDIETAKYLVHWEHREA